MQGLAEALGVTRHAVHKWRARYPPGTAHPFPTPDVELDGAPGWRPDRLEEIVEWREGLPGRGAGGGRPTLAMAAFHREAARHDFTREEALRMLSTFAAHRGESEEDTAAWLVREWTQ